MLDHSKKYFFLLVYVALFFPFDKLILQFLTGFSNLMVLNESVVFASTSTLF